MWAVTVALKGANADRLTSCIPQAIEAAENTRQEVRQILRKEPRAKFGGRTTVQPQPDAKRGVWSFCF